MILPSTWQQSSNLEAAIASLRMDEENYDSPLEVSEQKLNALVKREVKQRLASDRRRANVQLSRLLIYMPTLGTAIEEINLILKSHGFNRLVDGVYCGEEGRLNEEVGRGVYLALTWHKMEGSGHFEIVSYLS